MRRLLNVVASGRADLRPLVTHRFPLDRIEEAYDLFGHQRDGVLKVAIEVAPQEEWPADVHLPDAFEDAEC
jgi:threonine dehydrogenase-like Zn-dependent dehydrogenase